VARYFDCVALPHTGRAALPRLRIKRPPQLGPPFAESRKAAHASGFSPLSCRRPIGASASAIPVPRPRPLKARPARRVAGISAIEASYASRVVIVHDPLHRRRLQTGQFADETHAVCHMWRGILGRSAIILSIAFDIVAAVRRTVRSTLRQSSSGRSRGFADMAFSLSLGLRFEVERSAGFMGDVHRIRQGMSRRRRLAQDTAFAESRNARGTGLAGGLPKSAGRSLLPHGRQTLLPRGAV
jgi:hypothetical protein